MAKPQSVARKRLEHDRCTFMVQQVLKGEIDVNHTNGLGWSALTHAARNDDREGVSMLLDRGANVEHIDRLGWSALIHAVRMGYVAIVGMLLDHGADVHHVDNVGRTALSHAINNNRLDVARELLDRGARNIENDPRVAGPQMRH